MQLGNLLDIYVWRWAVPTEISVIFSSSNQNQGGTDYRDIAAGLFSLLSTSTRAIYISCLNNILYTQFCLAASVQIRLNTAPVKIADAPLPQYHTDGLLL